MKTIGFFISAVVFFSLIHAGCKKDKKEDQEYKRYTLTVKVDNGVAGAPRTGSYQYQSGSTVNYGYRVSDDYTDMVVMLGTDTVPYEGSFIMDGNKTLTVTTKQMVLWKYQTEKAVYYSTPAIGDDGTLYFGTGMGGGSAGTFFALSGDGALKWSFTGVSCFYSPAIDASGHIYVQDFGYNLYAFYPDGKLKWKFPNIPFPRMVENVGQRCPAISADGTVYICADGLYAISPITMEILWHFPGSQTKSSPAIGPDKTIYVVFGQDKVKAINPDGSLKWENRFNNPWEMSYAAPAIDDRGFVYIASEAFYEGKDYSALYGFRQDNGKIHWRYPVGQLVRASPVIGTDRSVYIATKATDTTNTARLICLSAEGEKRWEYILENVHVTPDDIYSTPTVGADGLIYFSAETGFLYAVRASDGVLAWKFDLKMSVNWSSPVILKNGTLYIGGMGGTYYEGYIRAIKTGCPGYAASPWPRFRHDNKNSGASIGSGTSIEKCFLS